jgi:hypothetical protein
MPAADRPRRALPRRSLAEDDLSRYSDEGMPDADNSTVEIDSYSDVNDYAYKEDARSDGASTDTISEDEHASDSESVSSDWRDNTQSRESSPVAVTEDEGIIMENVSEVEEDQEEEPEPVPVAAIKAKGTASLNPVDWSKANKVLRTDLPPMSEPRAMINDLTQRARRDLGFDNVLHYLKGIGREVRVATMFSGTEAPLLALQLITQSLGQDGFRFKHLFSAEIEPYVQVSWPHTDIHRIIC